MQAYCSLDHCEQSSVKFQSNYVNFQRKYFKISYAKRWPYCLGSNIGNGTNYRWIYDIIGNEYDHFFYDHLNVTIWFSCGKLASKSAILWHHFGEEIFSGNFGVLGRRILLNWWSHNHMASSVKSMSHKREGRHTRDEEYLDQTGYTSGMNVTVDWGSTCCY